LSVFLVILFACFLIVTTVLCWAARSAAGRSTADAALALAGRSVLSEYDTRLLADYGLLAFKGDEQRIEDDIRYYAGATLDPAQPRYAAFRSREAHTDTVCPQLESVTANLKGYSLLDLDIFEGQVTKAAAGEWAKGKLAGAGGGEGGEGGGEGRTLRNKAVLCTLPSAGYDGPLFPSIAGAADLPKGAGIASNASAAALTGEYILSAFTDHQSAGAALDGHFFRHEAEYVIAGKKGDEANYKDIKWRLRLIRMALNTEAIEMDQGKRQQLENLSNLAGPYKGIALSAMISCWAAAETHNDMMRLEDGDKVALLKTKAQWALNDPGEIFGSLGGGIASAIGPALGFEYGDTAVAPQDASGLDYEGYLRVLLLMLDRETKLLRMMDIIQINMKERYRGDFLLREYYTGFRFEAVVGGDKFSYEETY
jgi:hypothetical protein